jgi:hypothetical protein
MKLKKRLIFLKTAKTGLNCPSLFILFIMKHRGSALFPWPGAKRSERTPRVFPETNSLPPRAMMNELEPGDLWQKSLQISFAFATSLLYGRSRSPCFL